MIEGALNRADAAKRLGYQLDQFNSLVADGKFAPPHRLDDGLEYWWEHEVSNAAPSQSVADRNDVRRWIYPSVYIIGMEGSPFVKIGWAKHVPRRRLDLQCGCPGRLYVLASTFGEVKDEKRIHRALAANRAHGEWFRPENWLSTVIGHLAQPICCASDIADMLEARRA